MTGKEKKVTAVGPDEGEKVKMAGGAYRIILSGKQTGGSHAVIEMSVPPGAGPNPHSHPDFEETFYVLEGEVEFKSESGSYTAKENSFIRIPKGGTIHGFKNRTNSNVRLLCTVIPAGLDDFFQEASSFMTSTPTETEIKETMMILSEKYGVKAFPEDYLD
ncbi:cupin domain-containing protein [Flavobacterium amniphilum]|uniref:cupin domain-containing protein n=1 Tax=Flavobacterium amniphilum TaxID=1834035 RepID=UPI00202A2D37|nr:cupin domain-containing protein [Flavobacterium amniphilum]MCL9803984.1 cupin domain-containing protein [Flavobacterium amniphilum]